MHTQDPSLISGRSRLNGIVRKSPTALTTWSIGEPLELSFRFMGFVIEGERSVDCRAQFGNAFLKRSKRDRRDRQPA